MGYTHYWERDVSKNSAEHYGKLALDAKKIVEYAISKDIAIADWGGEVLNGDEWNEGRFAFNGYRIESHESFIWQAQPKEPSYKSNYIDEGWSFDFCKTAWKPYDCVVTAILCRAKHYYGDSVRIRSDGEWSDWQAGRDLYEEVFGSEPTNPMS